MKKFEYTITGTVENEESSENVFDDIRSIVENDLITGAAVIDITELVAAEGS